MTNTQGYAIEHPNRGMLTHLPYDKDESAHWAWSIDRRHGRVRRMTLPDARRAILILPEGSYILDLDTLAKVR